MMVGATVKTVVIAMIGVAIGTIIVVNVEVVIIEVIIPTIKNRIGTVLNVIILISRLELNVTAVASLRVEVILTIDVMTDVEEITDGAEMIAAIIAIPTETTIGTALSVTIRTSPSEPNVIAAVNLKAVVAQISNATIVVEMIAVEEMTGVVEMIAVEEIVDVAITAVVEEMTGAVEMTAVIIAIPMEIMIGNAENVKIQISHSEMNVTDVALLKEKMDLHLRNGKEMIAELETELNQLSQELETGNVRSAVNPTSQSAMIALAVAVQKEWVVLEIKAITVNYETRQPYNRLNMVVGSGGIANEC
jgi:hypothetical protein